MFEQILDSRRLMEEKEIWRGGISTVIYLLLMTNKFGHEELF